MGFPRQQYWSGLLFPSPRTLHNPGFELESSVLAGGFFTTEPRGKPIQWPLVVIYFIHDSVYIILILPLASCC